MLAIDTIVRLQDRGVTGSALLSIAKALKDFLYASLIALGIYWATLSHWIFLWDELVWIGGFAAIVMNISQWRGGLLVDQAIA